MSLHLEGRQPMPASGQACSYAVVELKGDAKEERDVIKHQGLLYRLETEAALWSQACSLAWDSLHTGLGKCRSQGRGEAGIGVLRAEMHTALHAICNAPSPVHHHQVSVWGLRTLTAAWCLSEVSDRQTPHQLQFVQLLMTNLYS